MTNVVTSTKKRASFSWRRVPGYAFLSIFALFSIFPLYFMAVSATNTTKDVLASRLIPGSHLFENFGKLFDAQNVGAE